MTEPIHTNTTPEASDNDVVGEIRQWVEGKTMGSTDSKAFCDLVDLYDRNAKLGLVEFTRDEPKIQGEIRTIGETIRQRTNELPGYRTAVNHVQGLIDRLESARTGQELYEIDAGITPNPKPRVREVLNGIKTQHITPPTSQ